MDYMDFDWDEPRRVVIDKLQVAGIVLVEPRLTTYYDAAVDSLRVQLEGFILGGAPQHIEWHPRWEVEVPASWWQHFKRDVLGPLAANPSTRAGWRVWLWAVNWERETREFSDHYSQTVYAAVCPHSLGMAFPPNKNPHVTFLLHE